MEREKIKVYVTIGYIFSAGIFSVYLIRYIQAVIYLQPKILTNNLAVIVLTALFPVCCWVAGTMVDTFNYWNIKIVLFYMVAINVVMVLIQPFYMFFWYKVIRWILCIEASRNFDEVLIIRLGRLVAILVIIVFAYIQVVLVKKIVKDEAAIQWITSFKIEKKIDLRNNKQNQYDINHVFKNLKSGKEIPIFQMDRLVHMLLLGASGTGKTSLIFLPMILCDLEKKIHNTKKRGEQLIKMIVEGKARLEEKEGMEVSERCIVATHKNYEKELSNIFETYGDYGTTIIAPNNALANDVIRIADARGLKVYILDPAVKYEQKNVIQMKFNPFYMPINISQEKRIEIISILSSNFAEVIQSVNELKGSTEQYFRDLGVSATSHIAVVCILHANINGKQTTFPEVQKCINDFSLLESMVVKIEQYLRIKIPRQELKNKDNKSYTKQLGGSEQDIQFKPIENVSQIPKQYRHLGVMEYNRCLKKEGEAYFQSLYFVCTKLMGVSAGRMEEQLLGLQNLVNKILFHPKIMDVFSGVDEGILDFDKSLSECHVTLINTAIEFGSQSSTALGLMTLLNLDMSVKRRPSNHRPLHSLMIDEANQYMHMVYDDMISLYRQYRVMCALAFQSLSQIERGAAGKYLRNVIMKAGTHVVFGRVDDEEMKIYEAMGGHKFVNVVQNQVNKNSIMEDNPSYTMGNRVSVQKKENLAGSDIRQRDFQEVSLFSIRCGHVMDGVHAKTFFVPSSAFDRKEIEWIDWGMYLKKNQVKKLVENVEEFSDSNPPSSGEEAAQIEDEVVITGIKETAVYIPNHSQGHKTLINPVVSNFDDSGNIGLCDLFLSEAVRQNGTDSPIRREKNVESDRRLDRVEIKGEKQEYREMDDLNDLTKLEVL